MMAYAMELVRALEQRRERGQTLVEYGLILTLMSLVTVVALTQVGGAVTNMFTSAINGF